MPETSNPPHLFLGIDGGASKVAACLVDDHKTVLSNFTLEAGANFHSQPLDEVIDHVVEAAQGVIAGSGLRTPLIVDRSVLGLAGCNFLADSQRLEAAFRRSALVSVIGSELQVLNDSLLGLRAGTTDGVGVVVVAGTGSNCYGRNQEGEEARSGGMDYLLSDEGSGYDIGLRLLKAVTRSLDGRLGATTLVGLVFEHLEVKDLAGFHTKVYQDFVSKPAIASLAPLVSEAAENGDQVAQDILAHSVNELIRMVDAVTQHLGMRETSFRVVQTGSVFKEHAYFRQRFADELKRVASKAELVTPEVSSAEAAAWLALEGKVLD